MHEPHSIDGCPFSKKAQIGRRRMERPNMRGTFLKKATPVKPVSARIINWTGEIAIRRPITGARPLPPPNRMKVDQLCPAITARPTPHW